jgi:class 3 adenylate cyclase
MPDTGTMETPEDDAIQQKNEGRPLSLVGSLVEVSIEVNDDDGATDDDISLSSSSSHSNDGRHDGRRNRRPSERVSNRQARQQMIENLVRFSYHTPNAVLEDLINHELKLCRTEQGQSRQTKGKTGQEGLPQNQLPAHALDGDSCHESRRLGSLSFAENDDQSAAKLARYLDAKFHTLPPNRARESALVFIDISGFTKLSTILDEETLSRVINSYFEKIIGEVKAHGGDVLKFAGDALFVEWRTSGTAEDMGEEDNAVGGAHNSSMALKELNSSLASMDTMRGSSVSFGLPVAVLRAARCAAAIVEKYSDHEVAFLNQISHTGGVLNVHCGIGCGELIGIHTSDYKEEEGMGEEEQAVETRREYLFLGKAIDQVML